LLEKLYDANYMKHEGTSGYKYYVYQSFYNMRWITPCNINKRIVRNRLAVQRKHVQIVQIYENKIIISLPVGALILLLFLYDKYQTTITVSLGGGGSEKIS
jgi:hypothetical protein